MRSILTSLIFLSIGAASLIGSCLPGDSNIGGVLYEYFERPFALGSPSFFRRCAIVVGAYYLCIGMLGVVGFIDGNPVSLIFTTSGIVFLAGHKRWARYQWEQYGKAGLRYRLEVLELQHRLGGALSLIVGLLAQVLKPHGWWDQ